jgi:hypothetical protein
MNFSPSGANTVLSVAAISLLISAFPKGAIAVPSYARQTGLPCIGCHDDPPELNPEGRLFKLLAYV